MRINTLRIMRCSDTMVIGEIEVAKINCYIKKCRDFKKKQHPAKQRAQYFCSYH